MDAYLINDGLHLGLCGGHCAGREGSRGRGEEAGEEGNGCGVVVDGFEELVRVRRLLWEIAL